MHWFWKCNFWKKSLSTFWVRWGQEVIFEVAEAKFWISSSFYKFSLIIFVVLGFEVVWPWRPQRPQKGLREFFQKLKSVRSNKKDEVCHSFLVKIFTKSLHWGGVVRVLADKICIYDESITPFWCISQWEFLIRPINPRCPFIIYFRCLWFLVNKGNKINKMLIDYIKKNSLIFSLFFKESFSLIMVKVA